ncbi:hypothetical protein RRF57_001453 [Xylaria bambusicola]|uniref:Uncharacterized protein n=1 Tax=Xylaria bambusicola TaxID=326684 RepID=A0AAN7UDU8_9PEZI
MVPSGNACPKKQFISFILSHQAFDGSVSSEVLIKLSKATRNSVVTLKSWLQPRTTLKKSVIGRVATTAVIVRTLESDYKDYEDLWTRIREKAVEYIRKQLIPFYLDEGFFEYSREMLDQLGGKVCLEPDTNFYISEESLTDQHNANERNDDSVESHRVLIHEAPTED